MTTRPPPATLRHLRLTRGKRICNLVRITPRTGDVLRFTDHDRALTFEGEQFRPVSFAAMSSRKVEAGLREGRQDIYGIVDGAYVTFDALRGEDYRGAEVQIIVTDWSMPWIVFGRHRRWIRAVTWTGSQWAGQLETRVAQLQRQDGGRFGGTFKRECAYRLGDAFCKKDISADVKADVVVQTVVDDRMECQFTTASWPGSYVDDYYRNGEIEWTVGDNAGHVSNVATYTHSNRGCTFLFPTPFPIQAGDEGIARPGCDGLMSTCHTKFDNLPNFGGDPHAPSPQEILDNPEDISLQI